MRGGVLPSGLITLWSGSKDAVPDGWALCDGSNGTPDLRDRFVVGAGSSYAVGATGGENTHTLTENEMPAHQHTNKYTTSEDRSVVISANNASRITAFLQGNGSSSVKKDGTTLETGGSAAHENRPPYYALCFIMKL